MLTLRSLFPNLPLEASPSWFLWADLPQLPESRDLQASLRQHGFDDEKLATWAKRLSETDEDHANFRRTSVLLTGLHCFVDQVDNAWIVCLQAPEGRALQTHLTAKENNAASQNSAASQNNAMLQNDAQDTVVFVALQPEQAVCVHDDQGIGVLLQIINGELQTIPVARPQTHRTKAPKLDTSLLLEALPSLRSNDPLLADWIDGELRKDNDWSNAVAAGMMARLSPAPKGAAAREVVQSLLRGNPPPPTPWQTFVQSWTPEQTEWMQALFQTKLATLAEDIDESFPSDEEDDTSTTQPDKANQTRYGDAEHIPPSPPDEAPLSSDDAIELLLRRDEIASVAVLLRAREQFAEYADSLQLLDQTGSIWIHGLDITPEIHQHPRLQRILQQDPQAWWAYPAATRILPDISALLRAHPPKTTHRSSSSALLVSPDAIIAENPMHYRIVPSHAVFSPSYTTLHASSAQTPHRTEANKTQHLTLKQTEQPRIMELEIFSPKLESSTQMRVFLSNHLLYEGPPKERMLLDCSPWQIDPNEALNLKVLCGDLRIEWSET